MTTEGAWPQCLPSQWGVVPLCLPCYSPCSLEAMGLSCPRAGNSGNRCSGPAGYGGSTGQTPLIYAIPCPLNYCHPPLPSSGVCGQPAGRGFYVFIMNSCTYVKIFFKIYVPFAYFPLCCGPVEGGNLRTTELRLPPT